MNNERGSVKVLHLDVDGLKNGRSKKKWKDIVEKDMVNRGLKMIDAQDGLLWRRGYKNWLTPACRDNVLCYRKLKEDKKKSFLSRTKK